METANFASAFLSHSSEDKDFVRAVANSLVQCGVLAWLDENELNLGPLKTKLKNAVEEQTIMLIFLSDNSIKSDWCQDEIRWAIEAKKGIDHLIPVYMGDRNHLVGQNVLLSDRFYDESTNSVAQKGVNVPTPSKLSNMPEDEITALADDIARQVANTIFPKVVSDSTEIAIYLDHRGIGRRKGKPKIDGLSIPKNIPILTFQPNLNKRQKRAFYDPWQQVSDVMEEAFSNAVHVKNRTRRMHILGNAQVGFFWLLGRLFDRTEKIELLCHGEDRQQNPIVISNEGWLGASKPKGGTAYLAPYSGELNGNQTRTVIYIGSEETYLKTAIEKIENAAFIWIPSPKEIATSQQAMSLTADLIATLEQLSEYNIKQADIIWSTAAIAATLAAAYIESHLAVKIRYLEWNHDSHTYIYLPMP